MCDEYAAAMNLKAACLYGGSSKGSQLREISNGVDFIVATPGRLIDLLNMRKITLRRVSYLVSIIPLLKYNRPP